MRAISSIRFILGSYFAPSLFRGSLPTLSNIFPVVKVASPAGDSLSHLHFLLNLFRSSVYTSYALSDGNHISSPSIFALQPLLSMNSISFLVELQFAGVPYCHHLRSAPLAEKGIRDKLTINAISAFFMQVLCT